LRHVCLKSRKVRRRRRRRCLRDGHVRSDAYPLQVCRRGRKGGKGEEEEEDEKEASAGAADSLEEAVVHDVHADRRLRGRGQDEQDGAAQERQGCKDLVPQPGFQEGMRGAGGRQVDRLNQKELNGQKILANFGRYRCQNETLVKGVVDG
jgi:hypothetical protein